MTIPSAEVEFRVAAQSAVAQMQQFGNMFKKQIKEMKDATDRFNKSKEKGPFEEWQKSLKQVAMQLTGVYGGVQMVQKVAELARRELEQMVEVYNFASQRQVPYQQSLSQIFRAMPGSEADPDGTMKQIDQMMKQANVTNKALLAQMAFQAASSTSNLPYAERFRVSVGLAEAQPLLMDRDPQAFQELARAAMVNAEAFGPDTGIKGDEFVQAQSEILNAGLMNSFIGDPRLYAKNAGGTAAKLRSFGLNQFQAYALFNAASNVYKDPEGNITADSLLNVIPQIHEFSKTNQIGIPQDFDELRSFLRGNGEDAKKIREHFIGVFGSDFDLDDEEKALFTEAQKNKAARANVKGRAKTKLMIMDLFQPAGEADDELTLNYKIEEAYQQFGVQRGPDGSINLDATYRSRAELARKKREYESKSPMFLAASGQHAIDVAEEQAAFAGVNIGSIDDFYNTMMKAGRPYYARSMDYADMLTRWNVTEIESQDVAFRKSVVENELRRKTGILGTVDPEWDTMRGLLDKGAVGRAEMDNFILGSRVSDKEVKQLQVLIDLHNKLTDIEQVLKDNKQAPQPVVVQNQPVAQPRKPAAEELSR
jgi:hypothetical protein